MFPSAAPYEKKRRNFSTFLDNYRTPEKTSVAEEEEYEKEENENDDDFNDLNAEINAAYKEAESIQSQRLLQNEMGQGQEEINENPNLYKLSDEEILNDFIKLFDTNMSCKELRNIGVKNQDKFLRSTSWWRRKYGCFNKVNTNRLLKIINDKLASLPFNNNFDVNILRIKLSQLKEKIITCNRTCSIDKSLKAGKRTKKYRSKRRTNKRHSNKRRRRSYKK